MLEITIFPPSNRMKNAPIGMNQPYLSIAEWGEITLTLAEKND
jgi:hypothetical protein